MTAKRSLSRQVRLLLGIGGFALGAAGYAGVRLAAEPGPLFHGTAYPDTPAAPDFSLVDHEGNPASLERWRASPLLLFSGFTSCPDVCPLTLSALSRVFEQEGIDDTEARVLLVTVDPENDTPERLAEYVAHFGPHVTGLTGDRATIDRVL